MQTPHVDSLILYPSINSPMRLKDAKNVRSLSIAVEFLLPNELNHHISRNYISKVMREFFHSLPEGCTAEIVYRHEKSASQRRYFIALTMSECCVLEVPSKLQPQDIVDYFVWCGMAARVVDLDLVNDMIEVQGKQKTIRLETEIETTDSDVTELLRQTLNEVNYIYVLTYRREHGFDLINSGALCTYGLGIILTDVESEIIVAAQDAMFEMGGGVTSVVRCTKSSSMKRFKPILQGDSFLVADLIPA